MSQKGQKRRITDITSLLKLCGAGERRNRKPAPGNAAAGLLEPHHACPLDQRPA